MVFSSSGSGGDGGGRFLKMRDGGAVKTKTEML